DGRRAHHGARCLGARLVPAVFERQGEVLRGNLERVELGRHRPASGAGQEARSRARQSYRRSVKIAALAAVLVLGVAAPGTAQMSNAEHWDMMTSPDACSLNEYWSFGMSMCLPRPTRLGNFRAMIMGAIFLADIGVTGARSQHELAAPNWLMLDAGVDLASW